MPAKMDNGNSNNNPESHLNDRIMLNVGGTFFETTISTLESGGPDSLLAVLANRPSNDYEPVFIDRDPEIFSVLLSLLRSNHLLSTANRFSKQELADEALYYGIESCLRSAMSPCQLSGIDASIVATIKPAADGISSVFTATDDGAVWIAHGGQISVYDWNLSHTSTFRSHLDDITSICRAWPDVAAVGSYTGAGLHFYDLSGGRHIESIHWTDPSDPRIYKAEVTAITNSDNQVFASFECPHRENCILVIDNSTLRIVSELGRQSGSSTKNMVTGKLTWMPNTGVLIGTAITCGAFGYSGYIRIWDPRSGNVVWETNEPGSGRSSRFGDALADVDADVEEQILFKICSKSGDLAMADLRKLSDDPWVYLTEKNPSLRNTCGVGGNSVLHCYKSQVFVGREGSLEVWSRVGDKKDCEVDRMNEESYRRNFVDKLENSERGVIRKIEGGGDRLFVSRQDVEGIEVWQSSYLSGAVSIL